MVRETRDSQVVEVLIDAKGRYEQFVDGQTGQFMPWWADQSRTGLRGEMAQARRQVEVANGAPVEWWCAERTTARAFNRAIRADKRLRGRIRAVYKPMIDQEG
jgi:hypothetical protein